MSNRKPPVLLNPGDLVIFKDSEYNEVMMYFAKSKDKKWWHRKYYFLSKGKIVAYPQSYLEMFEIIERGY